MKVAYDHQGQLVYAQTGITLDTKQPYFCPKCQRLVQCCQQKDGSYYFRHLNYARHEGETNAHQQGKVELCQQLHFCGIEAQLERYEQVIEQRPDISFTFKEREWTIEYQCSVIRIQEMIARTRALEQLGKKVWWILGERFLQKKYGDMLQYCLRYHPYLGNFIFLYGSQQLILCHHLQLQAEKQQYQYETVRLQLAQVDWRNLLELYQDARNVQPLSMQGQWNLQELQVLALYNQEEVRLFFQQLYVQQILITELPQACRRKPRYSWSMKSLRIIWTGYLVMLLNDYQTGVVITAEVWLTKLKGLIQQRKLRRSMCYHWEKVCIEEIEQLLEDLCAEGILQKQKKYQGYQFIGTITKRKRKE